MSEAHEFTFRQQLQDPALRQTPGFPEGHMEAILALSQPPSFTACPNPFVTEFCRRHGKPYDAAAHYEKPASQGDARSCRRHPVYTFHPYPTKVPPEIIRRLIEHYTEPGDLILDAFCGSGMTGVAAREAGRHALLGDLCPAATFIAAVNTQAHDHVAALHALRDLLAASEARWGHLYHTQEEGQVVPVNYHVWSDVFTCPRCDHEFPFFPHGVLHHGDKVETRRAFPCPACAAELNVRRVRRVLEPAGKKKALVWVNAGCGRRRLNRPPRAFDLELARQIESLAPLDWHPCAVIDPQGYSARLAQLGDKGITDVSRLLSRRNLIVLADLWARAGRLRETNLRNLCWATLSSIFTVISERQGYFGGGGGMSGNLYMPIVRQEKNVYAVLRRKLRKLEEAERAKEGLLGQVLVSTQSAAAWPALPDNSIDYIYTDPPFGANIIYSEMNQFLEAWLRVRTAAGCEAVIDVARRRSFDHYAALLLASFREYYRVLKPGRWMTVEFHNTRAAVWNLLQQVLGESGFVVAQVGVCDKGSTTILADIRPTATRHDLLISAYKPGANVAGRFALQAGSAEAAWTFVSEHLRQLPLPTSPGRLEERTAHLLYDRMVAFHVQRRLAVPLSAAEFHSGLRQRFVEREGMYFLAQQAAPCDEQQESGPLVTSERSR